MVSEPNIAALSLFWYWIGEREVIRKLKEAGASGPWTSDEILRNYHFCNVCREDDRGTKEIRAVVRHFKVDYWDLPWVYTAARLFNNAKTLAILLQNNWDFELLKKVREGQTIFHTAYVVSTCGVSVDKVDYVKGVVEAVKRRHIPTESCQAAFEMLTLINGMGSFLAGQVIADLKNHMYLEAASDWQTWSSIGPGSKKGLQYIFDKVAVSEKNYQFLMGELVRMMPSHIKERNIHMQDLQNCLCEFSKYMRLKRNEPGRRRPYWKEKP